MIVRKHSMPQVKGPLEDLKTLDICPIFALLLRAFCLLICSSYLEFSPFR